MLKGGKQLSIGKLPHSLAWAVGSLSTWRAWLTGLGVPSIISRAMVDVAKVRRPSTLYPWAVWPGNGHEGRLTTGWAAWGTSAG